MHLRYVSKSHGVAPKYDANQKLCITLKFDTCHRKT